LKAICCSASQPSHRGIWISVRTSRRSATPVVQSTAPTPSNAATPTPAARERRRREGDARFEVELEVGALPWCAPRRRSGPDRSVVADRLDGEVPEVQLLRVGHRRPGALHGDGNLEAAFVA
jgi:hypothetical protein